MRRSPTADPKPGKTVKGRPAGRTAVRTPRPKKVESKGDRPFLVAVGSSAGGLEALSDLFSHVPPTIGIPFVVVQHLSPKHPSMMVELLARKTKLKIRQVIDGDSPEPNTVYIVPPNNDVRISNGRLRLSDPRPEVHPVPSVDMLLQSLATERGRNAVAIILSGTGSDGSLGVRAIHAAGGSVLVQSPDSAAYRGMPQSAIQTACVNRVLPPKGLANCLLELVASQDSDALQEPSAPPDQFDALVARLRDHTSLDFRDYKRNTFNRRLERRLHACRASSLRDYLEFVDNNPGELDVLSHDLLVSVTAFFRDASVYDTVSEHLSPMLQRASPAHPLRIWVSGCATGEEVYTLAMLCADEIGIHECGQRVQIFATDINNEAMRVARRGVYSPESVRNIGEERIDRYFQRGDGELQIVKALRDIVMFARHDLVRDAPFGHIDLVSCRNVLIYFNPQLQTRVLSMFHFALNAGGLLLLGRSEGITGNDAHFEAISKRSRLFRSRGGPRTLVTPNLMNRAVGTTTPRTEIAGIAGSYLEIAANAYVPPSVIINERREILHVIGDVSEYVKLGAGKASLVLTDIIDSRLRADLLALLHVAAKGKLGTPGAPLVSRNRWFGAGSQRRGVALRAHALIQGPGTWMISFEPLKRASRNADLPASDSVSVELEQELRMTREHLQTVIEELETSNEELQALNEELQATNEELHTANEELETSNEELQATNEELLTVNDELDTKSQALAAAYADLDGIQKSVGYALLVADLDGHIVRANEAAMALFDFTLPHTVELLAERYPALEIDSRMKLALKPRGRADFQVSLARRHYLMHLSAWIGPNERNHGTILTLVDQTALVNAEHEAQRMHAAMRAMMDNSPGIVVVTDLRGRIEYANPAFRRLLAPEATTIEGETLPKLLPEDAAARLRGDELETLRLQHSISGEIQLPTRFGDSVFLSVRFPLHDHDGVIRAVCTKLFDVTAHRAAEQQVASQREMMVAILDSLAAQIVVIARNGQILATNRRWNDVARESLGDEGAAQLNASNYLEVCRKAARDQGDARRALRCIESVISGEREWAQFEYPCQRPDGLHWFSLTVTPLATGERGAVIAHTDITERRLAEQRARQVAVVFENASEGIIVFDQRGRVRNINEAGQHITGFSEHDIVNGSWRLLKPHGGQSRELSPWRFFARLRRDGHWRGELWGRKPSNGREYPMWVNVTAVRDEDGKVQNYVAMLTDITRLKDAESALYRLAYYDELTSLPNRTFFHEKLDHAVALAKRAQRLLAVMFIDLDRFKIINDSLGHDAGDGLLKAVADRLRDCVRRTDLVARLGGDEFVVLLEELRHQEDAAITAQKIISVLSMPFNINETDMQVSASVGIALFPHDADSMSDLLKNADTAMYRAKENGRNGFHFYTPDMHHRSQRRLWLENEMRHALAREEMRVVFEPQVRTGRSELRAVEALLRWEHASGSIITPTEFIPVAEEIGLVSELGRWVMHEACQYFRRALDAGLAVDMLAVNVSPLQLRDGHLQESVMTALSAARLRPDQLEIEVTESALLADQGKSADILRSLSALGVRIALDDFGTGFSSLTNLQLFPVSTVKIDRSFIRDIGRDSNDAGLVRAVLSMANVLGLDVVAEGVETASQQLLLQEWGCDCMQGYLFGESMRGDSLGTMQSRLRYVN